MIVSASVVIGLLLRLCITRHAAESFFFPRSAHMTVPPAPPSMTQPEAANQIDFNHQPVNDFDALQKSIERQIAEKGEEGYWRAKWESDKRINELIKEVELTDELRDHIKTALPNLREYCTMPSGPVNDLLSAKKGYFQSGRTSTGDYYNLCVEVDDCFAFGMDTIFTQRTGLLPFSHFMLIKRNDPHLYQASSTEHTPDGKPKGIEVRPKK